VAVYLQLSEMSASNVMALFRATRSDGVATSLILARFRARITARQVDDVFEVSMLPDRATSPAAGIAEPVRSSWPAQVETPNARVDARKSR
jgi:hypothetical protein